jgi:hypothetical protein
MAPRWPRLRQHAQDLLTGPEPAEFPPRPRHSPPEPVDVVRPMSGPLPRAKIFTDGRHVASRPDWDRPRAVGGGGDDEPPKAA